MSTGNPVFPSKSNEGQPNEETARVMAEAGDEFETSAARHRQKAKLINEAIDEAESIRETQGTYDHKALARKYGLKVAAMVTPFLTEEQIKARLNARDYKILEEPFLEALSSYPKTGKKEISDWFVRGELFRAHEREDVAQVLHENPSYVFADGGKPTIDSVIRYRRDVRTLTINLSELDKFLLLVEKNPDLEFDDLFDDDSLFSYRGLSDNELKERKDETLDLKESIKFLITLFSIYKFKEVQQDYRSMVQGGQSTKEDRTRFVVDFTQKCIDVTKDALSEINKELGPNAKELLGIEDKEVNSN